MRFIWQVRVESAEGDEDTRHSRFWAVVLGLSAFCLLVVVIALAVYLIELIARA